MPLCSASQIFGFPNPDYRYKLLASQIPHDAGLASFPHTLAENSSEVRTSAAVRCTMFKVVCLKPRDYGTGY